MTLRRLVALATMFVTFHLTLMGPRNACADHHSTGRSMSLMSATAAMPDHAMAHGGSTSPRDREGATHGCAVMSDCCVTAAIDSTARRGSAAMVATAIALPTPGQPLPSTLAPEPPPPRA